MRLLVFGGWGQLGGDLARCAEDAGHEVVRPEHAAVDVTDGAAVERTVLESNPDAVLDLAAFHRLEACEAHPEMAFRVNAVGAVLVARAARAAGARCVYVSSDYVFAGDRPGGYAEEDPPAPRNVYGVSKAAGELAVRAASPDALIVRGSGLFGHAGSSGKGGSNFVETMLAKARRGEDISVLDGNLFSPTFTRDMGGRIVALLERQVPPGVYHAANGGACSWFEFARAIFELAGVDAPLRPRAAGDDAVPRPRFSVLLDTKGGPLGLEPSRPWRDALRGYVESRVSVAPDSSVDRMASEVVPAEAGP